VGLGLVVGWSVRWHTVNRHNRGFLAQIESYSRQKVGDESHWGQPIAMVSWMWMRMRMWMPRMAVVGLWACWRKLLHDASHNSSSSYCRGCYGFFFPSFFLYYFSPQIRFEKFMPLAVTRRWKMKPKGDAPSDLRVIRLEEPLPLSPFLHI